MKSNEISRVRIIAYQCLQLIMEPLSVWVTRPGKNRKKYPKIIGFHYEYYNYELSILHAACHKYLNDSALT